MMRRIAFLFLPVIWLAACSRPSATPEIKPITLAQLDSLIQNREGNILVLNVWATWCVPCREEFPDLIRLADKYRSRNVDVVALSVDYPDEIEAKIQPFVQETGVNFPVFVQDVPEQEKLINFLNPEWNGAIPITLIFDEQGSRRAFLAGKQTLADFEKVVSEMVKN